MMNKVKLRINIGKILFNIQGIYQCGEIDKTTKNELIRLAQKGLDNDAIELKRRLEELYYEVLMSKELVKNCIELINQ